MARLVIFDFDGTLADTWPWFADELVAGAERLGYPATTRARIEDLRRQDTRAMFASLGVPLDKLLRFAADLRQRAETTAMPFRLFDGIADLLRALHAGGSRLAVVSSNTEKVVRRTLGHDLAALFADYRCEIDVFGKAPAFADILRQASCSPDDAVAVGDETRDLDAARAAGIRGLAVEWGFADPGLLRSHAPGRTAASIEELASRIARTSGNMR